MKTTFHIHSEGICLEHGKRQILFETITHLEADINYTIIHTADGQKVISAYCIKKFDEIVEKGNFVKTHKSFIINPLYLKSYQPNEKTLLLEGNRVVIVSRRKRESFEKTIKVI